MHEWKLMSNVNETHNISIAEIENSGCNTVSCGTYTTFDLSDKYYILSSFILRHSYIEIVFVIAVKI